MKTLPTKYSRRQKAKLIKQTRVAFASRQEPDTLWREGAWTEEQLKNVVKPVKAKDFTFKFMESHDELQKNCLFMYYLSKPAFQYYLPSFISLLVTDPHRVVGLWESLLVQLHCVPPFGVPIRYWIGEVENMEPEKMLDTLPWNHDTMIFLNSLKGWFLDRAHPEQISFTYDLSEEEKYVILQFLHYLETVQKIESVELVSLRAFYAGGSLTKRLGAASWLDVRSLIEVLELLNRKYASTFGSREVQQIIERLMLEREFDEYAFT